MPYMEYLGYKNLGPQVKSPNPPRKKREDLTLSDYGIWRVQELRGGGMSQVLSSTPGEKHLSIDSLLFDSSVEFFHDMCLVNHPF